MVDNGGGDGVTKLLVNFMCDSILCDIHYRRGEVFGKFCVHVSDGGLLVCGDSMCSVSDGGAVMKLLVCGDSMCSCQ